jgi:hypothetical protein
MKQPSHRRGYLLIHTLVFGAIGILFVGALSSWGAVNLRSTKLLAVREQSFQIAEAGLEYYRWHLAHAPQDFQDGTGAPGPYVHDYFDKDGNKIGTFTLTITPPPVGSTLVVVVSEGRTLAAPTVSRKLEARLAIPSLAKYAVAANAKMRFGEGTEVIGPIHSNDGIRFDGLARNVVTSAQADYDDPDHSGAHEFGVHTHLNAPPASGSNDSFRPAEAPPAAVADRPDVFEAGRQFPVPAIDFNGFASDLAAIKTAAQASGRFFAGSGSLGYQVVLKTNDTFDLYRVTSLYGTGSSCSDSQNQDDWGSWSIRRLSNKLGTYNFPANGLIFLQDDVWVEGQISGARLTIAAARFPENPSTNAHITVNEDLKYTYYDGQDVLGLIAQGNINIGQRSADNLRIDGALVAKNGRVGRYYYSAWGCSPYGVRDRIELYGMIATNERYGFAYTDNTGYQDRILTYDANLLYGPPPSFPLTADYYQVLSWREI